MVSSRTTAIMRRRVEAYLTARCSIERETQMKGSMGEPLHNWETVSEDVPCRVITAGQSGTEAVGSTEAQVEHWRLICPAGTVFTVDNRVLLADGRRYQIVAVDDGLTDQAFVGALMVRVRDE